MPKNKAELQIPKESAISLRLHHHKDGGKESRPSKVRIANTGDERQRVTTNSHEPAPILFATEYSDFTGESSILLAARDGVGYRKNQHGCEPRMFPPEVGMIAASDSKSVKYPTLLW